MKSTDELRRDHRVIQGVLAALEGLVQAARRGAPPDAPSLRQALEFSRTFIDACHHRKEERCLFPCLERRGIPREGGPIGVMLAEHQQGRELVQRITAALDAFATTGMGVEGILALCEQYISLLRQHIFKEDNILFAMGDAVLTPADDGGTEACYQGAEADLPAGTHQSMERLATDLQARYPTLTP